MGSKKPTMKEIMKAAMMVAGVREVYYNTNCRTQKGEIVEVKRLTSYFAERYGYSDAELAAALHLARSTAAIHRRNLAQWAKYSSAEKEKINRMKAILNNSQLEIEGWIARDSDDGSSAIHFFNEMPTRQSGCWSSSGDATELHDDSFLGIQWENDPVYAKMIITLT